MLYKITEIKEALPVEYRDTAQYAGHLYEALLEIEEAHIKLVAAQALAGIKQNPIEESTFRNTMADVKRLVVKELVKTANDINHRGDKTHEKEYKDGIR